jgi:transposase
MLKQEQWMDIKLLRKQGHSIRAIAEMSGHSRNTIRRILRQDAFQPYKQPERSSKLDNFKVYLAERFQSCRLSAVRLLAEIRPMGYTGSLATLRRFLATLRGPKAALGKLTVRFETPPGQQAQADWGHCGNFKDQAGKTYSLYVFVMVLSFSRMLYITFTRSMSLINLLRCHKLAFAFLGGWPQSILYDNMKQVRLDQERWTPLFLDFANYYGFIPKTHQPYRPRTKGKVERLVYYIKDNFLAGRVFSGLEDLELQALRWLNETANVRIHSTTHQQPVALWPQEKLTAVNSITPYQLVELSQRQVNPEGFVRFQNSCYSVPPELVGKTLQVVKMTDKIIIRSNDMIVAEHTPAAHPGQSVAKPEHLEALSQLTLHRPSPQLPRWNINANPLEVATTPLSLYEEVAV